MHACEPLPREIRLRDQGRTLEIEWSGGAMQSVAAATLRAGCRCAACEQARRAGRPAALPAGVCVQSVQAFGPNAVNLQFSDGHRRGIFPFAYLATLRDASTPAPRR